MVIILWKTKVHSRHGLIINSNAKMFFHQKGN